MWISERTIAGRDSTLAKSFVAPCMPRHKLFVPLNRSQVRCQAVSAVDSAETLQKARTEIARRAGSKHGTDKSSNPALFRPTEEKADIARIATSLQELDTLKQLNMTGTKWKLVFTESTASSAGKLGPFVGKVIQDFPADKPGQYINWLYLGPATISLLADYKQSTEKKIDVSFQWIQVELGIWRWRKELKNAGTWDSIFIDDDYRVFKANNKNVFVLEKLVE